MKEGISMNKYLTLFVSFFKIGLFTFGGGLAMLPLIEREVVSKHKWITSDEMIEIIAISESTPGPIAINAATFIGKKVGGFWGACVATLATCIPSIGIILLITLFIDEFLTNKFVGAAFYGIRACVPILILNAFFKLFKVSDKSIFSYIISALTIIGTVALPNISLIFFIIAGSFIGIIYFLIKNRKRGDDNGVA